jgi:hypothetical protein
MTTVIILVALIAIIALAPRFGNDSRDLGSSHTDTYPGLPNHDDRPVVSRLR